MLFFSKTVLFFLCNKSDIISKNNFFKSALLKTTNASCECCKVKQFSEKVIHVHEKINTTDLQETTKQL